MVRSTGVILGFPCDSCGKKLRCNYNLPRKGQGYFHLCMDCADDFGVSELFESCSDYIENVRKAQRKLTKLMKKRKIK